MREVDSWQRAFALMDDALTSLRCAMACQAPGFADAHATAASRSENEAREMRARLDRAERLTQTQGVQLAINIGMMTGGTVVAEVRHSDR